MKRFDDYYSYQGGTFLIARYMVNDGEELTCLDCGRKTPPGNRVTRRFRHDPGCPVHKRRQRWDEKMMG